ncbi:UNKNOWN [Stylonychia lemnae]|uniref:Uncharacterized protein n=1 Tax=Stylonychia lemnae TaxID=5949 RepID=A0A078A1W7_STYLE|nr:UNKNOWN [Stylonychia lemnae]|eukprot:CDW74784.1 UNKNOWN [Stylonychia lemnae]
MSDYFLRVKQLRSCPYISFKFLNFLVILNQFVNIVLAIILNIELYDSNSPYVYGYLIAELTGLAIAVFAYRIASNLLTMGRTRRKWVLQILYMLQLLAFLLHFIVSLAMWLNFNFLSEYIAYNKIDYLKGLDSFKNIAVYLGFSSLLLGLDVYLTIYFRKFLGREQIRIEEKDKRLREFELYQNTVYNLYEQLGQEDIHDIRGTRKRRR